MVSTTRHIEVNISQQTLTLYDGVNVIKTYPVCTARNGLGEQAGSEKTPRGKHVIRAKIGDGAPLGSVFVGRRFTGEVYTPALATQFPHRDWILTRILWLSGLEVGKNRGGSVDTMRRYIYIHGAPDELMTTIPSSHGCIRMFNDDVVSLFNRIETATPIQIIEE